MREIRAKLKPNTISLEEIDPNGDRLVGPDKDPLEILCERESGSLIHRAINSCPQEHWEILAFANVDGLSAREIGAKLGISEGATYQRISRARKVLQAKIRELSAGRESR